MSLILAPASGPLLHATVHSLRVEDLQEVSFLCPRKDPRLHLLNEVPNRHALIASAKDGTPLVLFGCVTEATHGVPWMLCTDAVQRHRLDVLRTSRRFVDSWLQQHRVLCNTTWAGNTMHHRFIESMGFTIHRDRPAHINGGVFLPFHKAHPHV